MKIVKDSVWLFSRLEEPKKKFYYKSFRGYKGLIIELRRRKPDFSKISGRMPITWGRWWRRHEVVSAWGQHSFRLTLYDETAQEVLEMYTVCLYNCFVKSI